MITPYAPPARAKSRLRSIDHSLRGEAVSGSTDCGGAWGRHSSLPRKRLRTTQLPCGQETNLTRAARLAPPGDPFRATNELPIWQTPPLLWNGLTTIPPRDDAKPGADAGSCTAEAAMTLDSPAYKTDQRTSSRLSYHHPPFDGLKGRLKPNRLMPIRSQAYSICCNAAFGHAMQLILDSSRPLFPPVVKPLDASTATTTLKVF